MAAVTISIRVMVMVAPVGTNFRLYAQKIDLYLYENHFYGYGYGRTLETLSLLLTVVPPEL
jgi:hypothetical protein